MFQPQFHSPVWSGRKRSTIRRNARCKPGEELSLRKWSGRPYGKGTTQIELRTAVCTAVMPISIGLDGCGDLLVIEGGEVLSSSRMKQLAEVEGFDDLDAMREWFEHHHKLKPGDDLIQRERITW
jgi:hypothetical protein